MNDIPDVYRVLGWRVESEVSLPWPETTGGASGERVEVSFCDPSDADDVPCVDRDGVSKAYLLDDSTVGLDRSVAEDPPLLRATIVLRCLAAKRFAQGHAVLHASAGRVDGRAVAFAGAPDHGKSSLAVGLYGRGATVLTDDVLVVDTDPDPPVVVPSHPRVSIAPDVCDSLGVDLDTVMSGDSEWTEPWHDVRDGFTHEWVPLDTVYLLADPGGAPEPAVEPADARTTVTRLLEHFVRFSTLLGGEFDTERRQFQQCARLAEATEVKSLVRPDGVETTRDVLAAVEEDVG